MKTTKLLFSIILLAVLASCEPDALQINAETLKKMMSENGRLVILDTRTEQEYQRGHIPKAINITETMFHTLDAYLPKEKDTPLVFYCRGVG
jgi:rhodanese-related sulfurtransferase